MCIAINKPKDKKLANGVWQDCFERHSDGAGFAYVDNGDLIIKKGFFKFEEFMDAFLPVQHLDAIVHFRSASPSMIKNAQNCHPFRIESTAHPLDDTKARFAFAIIHNGRLEWRHTADHSDTSCFVHDLLSQHLDPYPWMLDKPSGMEIIKRAINYKDRDNNKMVIMRYDRLENETKVYIINYFGKDTNEHDGMWFSNYSWKIAPKKWESVDGYGYGHGHDSESYFAQAAKNAKKSTHINPVSPMAMLGFKDFAPWRVPDPNGWVWDFVRDNWLNVRTKLHCPDLHTQNRPYEMIDNKMIPLGLPRWKSDAFSKLNELNKPDNNVIQLALPDGPIPPEKDINVPRDEWVEKDKIILVEHLEKAEMDAMVVEAKEALKREGYKNKEIRFWNDHEMIDYLRSHVSAVVEDASSCSSVQEIDILIIMKIKEGSFRLDLIACEEAFKAEENELQRAEKAAGMVN